MAAGVVDAGVVPLVRPATGASERYVKADFSFMPVEAALPGVHVAPTVALFRREGDGYVPVAIRVGARVFTPNDRLIASRG